jgi:hypothetical protein
MPDGPGAEEAPGGRIHDLYLPVVLVRDEGDAKVLHHLLQVLHLSLLLGPQPTKLSGDLLEGVAQVLEDGPTPVGYEPAGKVSVA